MPQLGDVPQPQASVEDSFLDLVVESLEGLEEFVRGQFLRRFFRTLAQIDLSAAQSNEYWGQIVQRRRELASSVGTEVSLKTAIVDVLVSTGHLHVPILMEYGDFKKLQISAATDALTGLYNRRLFDEYCDKELNRAKRYSHNLAVVILDLHLLKEVNDRHGHLQGDKILQLAAATLRKTLRASDFAFRIGGDEFTLLLPQTDPEQAITLCRRVRVQYEAGIRELKLDVGVTVDFGVAVHPQDGDQKHQLMRLADERLYQLKHSARTNSRVIPLESRPATEARAPAPSPSPTPIVSPATAGTGPELKTYLVQRKWERVSLAGTKAHAILADAAQKTATVIDLSYGGVALLMKEPEDLPAQFNAVLHVPILPPVRVILKKAYAIQGEGGNLRIGCSFVS